MLILFHRKFFNRRFSIYDQLKINKLPYILPNNIDIIFGNDDRLLNKADVIVLDLPFMRDFFFSTLKPAGQVWVAWCLESTENHPWIQDEQVRAKIDIWMTYHQTADIVMPYYENSFINKLRTPPSEKRNNLCMFISNPINKSKRLDYLRELMNYINIDSYGSWCNNKKMLQDYGYISKIKTISKYKFTIAFENAIEMDYITEKFFEPLIAGSVPIYLGAPNVEKYSPGDNSFIDIRNFETPQKLANSIIEYCQNDSLYSTLLVSGRP